MPKKEKSNNDVKTFVNKNCVDQFSKIFNHTRKTCYQTCIIDSLNFKFYQIIPAKVEKFKNFKGLYGAQNWSKSIKKKCV